MTNEILKGLRRMRIRIQDRTDTDRVLDLIGSEVVPPREEVLVREVDAVFRAQQDVRELAHPDLPVERGGEPDKGLRHAGRETVLVPVPLSSERGLERVR